eukprot:scaffold62365_cov44-Cyclotella_meneghiniana.AAC.14
MAEINIPQTTHMNRSIGAPSNHPSYDIGPNSPSGWHYPMLSLIANPLPSMTSLVMTHANHDASSSNGITRDDVGRTSKNHNANNIPTTYNASSTNDDDYQQQLLIRRWIRLQQLTIILILGVLILVVIMTIRPRFHHTDNSMEGPLFSGIVGVDSDATTSTVNESPSHGPTTLYKNDFVDSSVGEELNDDWEQLSSKIDVLIVKVELLIANNSPAESSSQQVPSGTSLQESSTTLPSTDEALIDNSLESSQQVVPSDTSHQESNTTLPTDHASNIPLPSQEVIAIAESFRNNGTSWIIHPDNSSSSSIIHEIISSWGSSDTYTTSNGEAQESSIISKSGKTKHIYLLKMYDPRDD